MLSGSKGPVKAGNREFTAAAFCLAVGFFSRNKGYRNQDAGYLEGSRIAW